MTNELAKPRGSRWLDCFLDFLGNMTIASKELDAAHPMPLLDVMYQAQYQFLEEICEGLERGVHDFKCLKARQLGISTISLAIDVFWLSVHDRMQGALITDDDANKEKMRILLEQYITGLPKGLRVGIKTHNRNNLVLANGSVLDYMVAGKTKGKDTLGTSRALNFVHATECANWGSRAGVDNLTASLAQRHPDRLYIWESTAKGFNMWWDMWDEARKDTLTQKAFFIGWWAKEDYALDDDSALMAEYWDGSISEEEEKLIETVHQQYGHSVTPNQIAWYRYMMTARVTDSDQMAQQYPWHEEQAFILSGKSFFPIRRITENVKFLKEMGGAPVKAYRYHMGENFLATQIEELSSTENCDLRVWEEPQPAAAYVMGIDPAFGRNEFKDRHCIEVYRCFADKIVQVAEYAADDCETYQVAWIMAHLAGSYKNVWINLEVNGPGFAVMRELTTLRQQLDAGYLRGAAQGMGLLDVFSSARWYLYHRPDSMGPGYVYGWKTTSENKQTIMNQFRDSYALNMMLLRSFDLLGEMERMVQDGFEIQAEGKGKDDRVFATALAIKTWVDWVRPGMITTDQTYSRVLEEERIALETPSASMIGRIVQDFFKGAEIERLEIEDRRAWGDL